MQEEYKYINLLGVAHIEGRRDVRRNHKRKEGEKKRNLPAYLKNKKGEWLHIEKSMTAAVTCAFYEKVKDWSDRLSLVHCYAHSESALLQVFLATQEAGELLDKIGAQLVDERIKFMNNPYYEKYRNYKAGGRRLIKARPRKNYTEKPDDEG